MAPGSYKKKEGSEGGFFSPSETCTTWTDKGGLEEESPKDHKKTVLVRPLRKGGKGTPEAAEA